MDTIEQRAGIVATHRGRPRRPLGGPAAGGSQGMQFNGGNVIECAFVYPVFVGTKWQDNQTWAALAGDLQLFMKDVFSSSYVSTLYQYGFLAGASPGAHFEGAPASSTLDDPAVAQIVANLKNDGVIPVDAAPSQSSIAAHVAMIFIDDTVQFNDPNIGGASCVQLYGYHYFNTNLLAAPFYYGLIAPMTDACVAGDPYMSPVSQLDRLTRVASHELGRDDQRPRLPERLVLADQRRDRRHLRDHLRLVPGELPRRDDQHLGGAGALQPLRRRAGEPDLRLVLGGPVHAAGGRAGPRLGPEVASAASHLLPLPPTYRQGGKIVRKPSEVHRYVRRIMGGFSHQQIHAQLPDLLREMAQVMERGAKLGQAAPRPAPAIARSCASSAEPSRPPPRLARGELPVFRRSSDSNGARTASIAAAIGPRAFHRRPGLRYTPAKRAAALPVRYRRAAQHLERHLSLYGRQMVRPHPARHLRVQNRSRQNGEHPQQPARSNKRFWLCGRVCAGQTFSRCDPDDKH